MKKLITVILAFAGLNSFAQKTDASKVPAVVKTAFAKQYPGLTAKWGKEDGKYEANFKQNGNAMSALYETNGTMIESEVDIKVSALPIGVLVYMKEHYKGKTIKEGAKITKADGTINYEAEVDKKDVVFDANSKFIKEIKD